MDNEQIAIILIIMQIASCFLSAYNWNRRQWLRKSPILTSVFCGFVFHLSGFNLHSSLLLLLLVSLLIGVGFYFSAWIQCKNEDDPFI